MRAQDKIGEFCTDIMLVHLEEELRRQQERTCQIRMSQSLWNLLGDIAHDLGYVDNRGHHSTVIREMVSAAAAKWKFSPYICRGAQYTVFLTKDGHLFFRAVQVLRLNSERERLPCALDMKLEKKKDYRRKKPSGKDGGDWFRSQWAINHFAVWNGKRNETEVERFEEKPLSSFVDEEGASSKAADLPVRLMSGRFLTREIIVGLRDYVQRKESGTPNYDRADIPIDIPMSDLEIAVIIDRDLYHLNEVAEEEIPNLALEFRNREGARFEEREVGNDQENPTTEIYGRFPEEDEGVGETTRRLRALQRRLEYLENSTTTEGQKVAKTVNREILREALENPERFLYYRLTWPSPHLGINVCIRWEKPVRDKNEKS